jgi:hypothetical protein
VAFLCVKEFTLLTNAEKISHKISLKNIDSHRLYRKKLNRCKYRIGEMRISISQQYRYIVRIPIHDAKYIGGIDPFVSVSKFLANNNSGQFFSSFINRTCDKSSASLFGRVDSWS